MSFYNNALVQRLEIVRELLPNASQVAILINLSNPNAHSDTEDVQGAAQNLGLRVIPISMSRKDEVDAAFARVIALKADAMIVTTDAVFQSLREPLVAAALSHRLPAIWGSRTPSQVWWLSELWHECRRNVSSRGQLCGPHPQRWKTRQLACVSADQVRVGH